MSVVSEARPEDALGHEPRVESEEDVERALEELGWLDAAASEIAAEAKAAADRISREAKARMVITFGSASQAVYVPYGLRQEQLRAAVLAYVAEHPEAGCCDGKKSREYVHGTVGSRIVRGGVTYTKDARSAVQAVLKLCQWAQLAAAFLAGVVLRGKGKDKRTAAQVLKVKPEVDLQAAQAAFDRGELDKGDLKAFGLSVRPERDEPYIKPRGYRVEREPSRAA